MKYYIGVWSQLLYRSEGNVLEFFSRRDRWIHSVGTPESSLFEDTTHWTPLTEQQAREQFPEAFAKDNK